MTKKKTKSARKAAPGDWEEVGRSKTGFLQLGSGGGIVYLVDRVERTRRWPDGTIECSTVMESIPVNLGELAWFQEGKFRHLAAWARSMTPEVSNLVLELRRALDVMRETKVKKPVVKR